MRNIVFIIPIVLIVLSSGCRKFKPPISYTEIKSCHQSGNWDSTAIHNHLIGKKFKLEFGACFSLDDNEIVYHDTKDESFLLYFKSSDSIEVIENGQVTQNSSWGLFYGEQGNYQISTAPYVIGTYGLIAICDEWLLLNGTITESCDNYYREVE